MGETGYPMTNKSGVGVNPSVVAEKDRKIRKLQNDIEQARKREQMFDQSKRYFDEMLKDATLKNKQVNDMDTKMRMLEVDAQQARDLQIQLNDTLAEKYVLERKIQDLVESPFIKNVEGQSSTYKRLGELEKANLQKEDEIKFMKEKLRQYTQEMKTLKDENQIYKSQNDKLSKRYQGMGINMEEMAQMLKSLDPTKLRNYSFEHLSYEGKTPAWAHMDFMQRSKPLDVKDSSSLVRQIDRLQGQKALLASELEKAQFLIREQIDIEAQLKETHQNSVDQLRAQIQNANRQVARAQIDKKKIEDQLQDLKGQYLQKGGKINFEKNIPGGDVSVFSSDTVDTILGPQQNVIDLLISTADYDKTGLKRVLQNFDMHKVESNISTFFTLDFFSHQPHTTMQVAGLSPKFDVQISYKDKIDRFFIQQAKNNQVNIIIEVYYPLPDKIILLGKATIPIKNLVQQANHSASPVVHSSAMIYSQSGNVSIGYIQYHLRFRQSIKQALGDFSSQQQFLNTHSAMNALTHADDSSLLSDGKRVRVKVTIHRASELTRGGHSSVPINAFINYTFYNQSSCYTPAVKSSSPVFEHTYSYDFTADDSLRRYIANEKIKFLVFDDSQPLGRPGVVSQDMLGVCQVPIRQLLTGNHRIQDIFPIMNRTDARGNLAITIQLINIRGQDARKYQGGAESALSQEWKDRFLEKIAIKLMEKKLDLDQAFRQFDIDSDRRVNAQDFRNCVIKLRAQVSDVEIDSFLRESVIKRDGGLDKAQFQAIFMPIMQNLKISMQNMVVQKFKEACLNKGMDQLVIEFKREDYNKRGYVDEQGFKNVLRALKLSFNQNQFDSLWIKMQSMGRFQYMKWWQDNYRGQAGISRNNDTGQSMTKTQSQFQQDESIRDSGEVAKVKLVEFLDSRDMPLDSFFSVADTDKNNRISKDEFRSLLQPMKAAKLSMSEIDALFEYLDQNNSKAIQLRQLQIGLNLYNIRYIIKRVHQTIIQSGFNLIQLFQLYSKGNNYLSKQQLHSMLSEIGSKISANQATAFMTYFDTRKNNRIDITQFIEGFYKAIQFDGYQIPLQKIINRINKKIRLSQDSVKQSLAIFDKNNSRMISFYEFIAVLETQYRIDLSRKQKNTVRNFFYEHQVTTDSLEINQNVIFNLINAEPRPNPKVISSTLTAAVKKLKLGLQKMKIKVANFLSPFQKGEGEFQIYCLASAAIEFGKLDEDLVEALINACDQQNHGMIDFRKFQQLMNAP